MNKLLNQNKNRELSESEKAVELYRAYRKSHKNLSPKSLETIFESLQHQTEFQEFARFGKIVKTLFDQTNFRLVYVTENVEAFSGYTAQELMEGNVDFIFSLISSEHIDFATKAMTFSLEAKERCGIEPYKKNRLLTWCGVKGIKKDGSLRRLLIKYMPLELDETGNCLTAMITCEDISFLVKADFYWARITFGDNKEHVFHFISDTEKDIKNDIISDREKDVLRLLSQGMESKDIAKELFISSGTVDNHRKNMIARTGARDTTALLQLCIMCGII